MNDGYLSLIHISLLDGEEEKVTAQQTLDTSLLNGTYASYTYDESLNEYEEQIESLQEQIEEAQELVDEYTASIETCLLYTSRPGASLPLREQ